MRADYLDYIDMYRKNNHSIFYQDESLVFENLGKSKIWKVASKNGLHFNNYKIPSGSGQRAILCHIGSSETGLLEGALLCFYGSKAL